MTSPREAKRAIVRVRVVPRAARDALTRDATGGWRAHLTAPPVEGAANRALIALLADRLALPKRAFALLRGERGRDKVVAIEGASAAEVEARLAAAGVSRVDKASRRG
jgi:uncharacterized protein YggU (UPF0235/DUF167 family)